MAKPTKKQKAKRRSVKATRKVAKIQRKKTKQNTIAVFGRNVEDHIDARNQPEDFSQAAARTVREATKD
jgi:hypothetical protein